MSTVENKSVVGYKIIVTYKDKEFSEFIRIDKQDRLNFYDIYFNNVKDELKADKKLTHFQYLQEEVKNTPVKEKHQLNQYIKIFIKSKDFPNWLKGAESNLVKFYWTEICKPRYREDKL